MVQFATYAITVCAVAGLLAVIIYSIIDQKAGMLSRPARKVEGFLFLLVCVFLVLFFIYILGSIPLPTIE
jgi:hypothetical protein